MELVDADDRSLVVGRRSREELDVLAIGLEERLGPTDSYDIAVRVVRRKMIADWLEERFG